MNFLLNRQICTIWWINQLNPYYCYVAIPPDPSRAGMSMHAHTHTHKFTTSKTKLAHTQVFSFLFFLGFGGFFWCVVLAFKHRALYLLGRPSTIELIHQPIFVQRIFKIGSQNYLPRVVSNLLISASWDGRITNMNHQIPACTSPSNTMSSVHWFSFWIVLPKYHTRVFYLL
jgi:hypothetical protein